MARDDLQDLARRVVARCRELATSSEEPGRLTRTFLSPPMHEVHARVERWMRDAGLAVHVDGAGNIRGTSSAAGTASLAPPLIVGSHLDTVPNAGAFDGILGVMMGIALAEIARADAVPVPLEVIGFSEEEGVRFGRPFIGSLARVGALGEDVLMATDASGRTVRDAISAFGLDVSTIVDAQNPRDVLGYLEFHIEQGPVLDDAGLPVGVVDAITGQSRLEVTFIGAAGHAGTTPMSSRRDALAGAAAWVASVEAHGRRTPGLVATVGRMQVTPGATNVIAGRVTASLDVRHRDDAVRTDAVNTIVEASRQLARERGLDATVVVTLDQAAVAMAPAMVGALTAGVREAGTSVRTLTSGAGHDAMVMARVMPVGMLFLRNARGISHHPNESVEAVDVAVALDVGRRVLERIAREARQQGLGR